MNLLHIYAQARQHDEVVIVGDKDALVILLHAITKALAHGEGKSLPPVFVNDGEGYDVLVYQATEEEMDKLPVPYTDDMATAKDWSELTKLIKERSVKP